MVDFITTIVLVELVSVGFSLAMIAGALSGAGTNFIINRYWSFNAARQPTGKQGIRYALVWTGSLILNIAGTFALVQFLQLSYVTAKLIVALMVGWGFNYILQKKFVFAIS